jgi:hypothetical protein
LRRRCYGSSLGNLAPLALAIFASTGEIPLAGSNVKLRWRDPAMCDHEGAWAIRPPTAMSTGLGTAKCS